MAYNSQCAQCSTPSRRILRNETGSYPGGQHCAQYRVQGLSGAKLDDDATPVSRPLNIAHNTLPQVFARMGLLPQNRISKEEAVDLLTENGFFDLPTVRKQLDRSVFEQEVNEMNAIVDYHNAQCLQRGEPDEMINVAKDDDEPYPRARGN
jgi:hypothetical protein